MAITNKENVEPAPEVPDSQKELAPDLVVRVVRNEAEIVFVPNKFESASKAIFDKYDADLVYVIYIINIDDIAVHSPESGLGPSNDIQRNDYPGGDIISEDDAAVFMGDLMDTSTESSTIYNEDNADTDTDDEQQNVDEPVQFTVEQVFNHLRGTLLPETWCWVTNPADENSIIFVQIDRHTLNI